MAAQEWIIDVVEALLVAGASPDLRDAYGNGPLWTATFNSRGRGEVIALLLSYGADPDSKNAAGASPRSLAHTIASFDVARHFGP